MQLLYDIFTLDLDWTGLNGAATLLLEKRKDYANKVTSVCVN